MRRGDVVTEPGVRCRDAPGVLDAAPGSRGVRCGTDRAGEGGMQGGAGGGVTAAAGSRVLS